MNRAPSARPTVTAAAIAIGRKAVTEAARAAVPQLADFCVIHLVTRRTLICVAGEHSTAEGRRDVRALMRLHRIRVSDADSTVAHVVRTGRPLLRVAIRLDSDGRARPGSVAELHRRLAPTSALVVPIAGARAVLGTVSLCYSLSGRSYAARHLRAAQRLAAQIARAIDPGLTDGALRLRPAARNARQGTPRRRPVAPRD